MSIEQMELFALAIKKLIDDIHLSYLSSNIIPATEHLSALIEESGLSFEKERKEKERIPTVFDDTIAPESLDEKIVSDEQVCNILKMLNTYPEIITMKRNVSLAMNLVKKIKEERILEYFKEDKDFYQELERIMTHDKSRHRYLFHGTQSVEDARSIIQQGLGMIQDGLKSTTYSEFSIEQLLLYQRGHAGDIGKDAVVIIDQPLDEEEKPQEIVEERGEDQKLSFGASGLQWLEGKAKYIVNSRFIVGYVDKKNRQVVLNPQYYDYERIKKKDEKITLKTIEEETKKHRIEK